MEDKTPLVDEEVEEVIEITEEYVSKLSTFAAVRKDSHVIMRKVECQIQNCIYFKQGMREHFVKAGNV